MTAAAADNYIDHTNFDDDGGDNIARLRCIATTIFSIELCCSSSSPSANPLRRTATTEIFSEPPPHRPIPPLALAIHTFLLPQPLPPRLQCLVACSFGAFYPVTVATFHDEHHQSTNAEATPAEEAVLSTNNRQQTPPPPHYDLAHSMKEHPCNDHTSATEWDSIRCVHFHPETQSLLFLGAAGLTLWWRRGGRYNKSRRTGVKDTKKKPPPQPISVGLPRGPGIAACIVPSSSSSSSSLTSDHSCCRSRYELVVLTGDNFLQVFSIITEEEEKEEDGSAQLLHKCEFTLRGKFEVVNDICFTWTAPSSPSDQQGRDPCCRRTIIFSHSFGLGRFDLDSGTIIDVTPASLFGNSPIHGICLLHPPPLSPLDPSSATQNLCAEEEDHDGEQQQQQRRRLLAAVFPTTSNKNDDPSAVSVLASQHKPPSHCPAAVASQNLACVGDACVFLLCSSLDFTTTSPQEASMVVRRFNFPTGMGSVMRVCPLPFLLPQQQSNQQQPTKENPGPSSSSSILALSSPGDVGGQVYIVDCPSSSRATDSNNTKLTPPTCEVVVVPPNHNNNNNSSLIEEGREQEQHQQSTTMKVVKVWPVERVVGLAACPWDMVAEWVVSNKRPSSSSPFSF